MDRPIHNQIPFGPPGAGTDPFALFDRWFCEARQADPNNAAVVALATAAGSRPSLRMVLLKKHGPDGFIFYTRYDSRKGRELDTNPAAAMTFWWPAQERQVRLEGIIGKISSDESDAYFATRPRESQLSAWASPQSRVIEHPVSLDEPRKRFGTEQIPRPENWGGYCLTPDLFEFWQGRDNRLHDRIRFANVSNVWKIERLAP